MQAYNVLDVFKQASCVGVPRYISGQRIGQMEALELSEISSQLNPYSVEKAIRDSL